MKYCKDCKHFSTKFPRVGGLYACTRDTKFRECPVLGLIADEWSARSCKQERAERKEPTDPPPGYPAYDMETCGPEAKFFQRRPDDTPEVAR